MAATTVDINRLNQAGKELEQIHTLLVQNEKELAQLMEHVKAIWQSDAASTFINAYTKSAPELANMSKLVQSTALTLSTIAVGYNKQETSAAEAVRSMLPKG